MGIVRHHHDGLAPVVDGASQDSYAKYRVKGSFDTVVENIKLLNQAIVGAGGPPNLITAIPNPTLDSAREVMRGEGDSGPMTPAFFITPSICLSNSSVSSNLRGNVSSSSRFV